MRKLILAAIAFGVAVSMAGQKAAASAAYCSNNSNPRTFNVNTGLAVGSNLIFEVDIKYPDAATQPALHRQTIAFGCMAANTGNNAGPRAGTTPMVGFRLVPTVSTDANGAPLVLQMYYNDGIFSTTLVDRALTASYDHKWHHVTFAVIQAPDGTTLGLGPTIVNPTPPPANINRPGMIFLLDGIEQGRAVIGNITATGLGNFIQINLQNENNTNNVGLQNTHQVRIDNLRVNGELLDSFENRVATPPAIAAAVNMMNGAGGWNNAAATIAQCTGGFARWLNTAGNVGQYRTETPPPPPGSPAGDTDGSAVNSDFAQGSIFLNAAGTAKATVVAADRTTVAGVDTTDTVNVSVDFKFPTLVANPQSAAISFSVVARMYGVRGFGSFGAGFANAAPGVECRVYASANTNAKIRAEVFDKTTTAGLGASVGAVNSTANFDQNWHRLTFSVNGTAVAVSIDGVALSGYLALTPSVAGVNDGENFALTVNPGTGGSAASNPRLDNITVNAIAIDDFSTYIPQEILANYTANGLGTIANAAANLRLNTMRTGPVATPVFVGTQAVLNDTPWINGQVISPIPAENSNPALFRMTSDNSTFGGPSVNAVRGWTLY